jgi:CRISPR-associated endoribonuclease Cas6
MIVKITLEFDELTLPVHMNHILQAVIMKWLSDENFAKFVHDVGYSYGKRRYKLFSFSSLYGENTFNNRTKMVTFYHNASFFLSAVDELFLEYVMNTIVQNSHVQIISQDVFVSSISLLPPNTYEKVIVKTVSPVSVYKTDVVSDKVQFLSPDDEEFERYINDNARRKLSAYFGESSKEFVIRHVGSNPKKAVVKYKKGFFVGWKTMFEIEGNPEIINFLIGSGLGSKNSAGFGCIIPIEYAHDI